ncbi:Shedu anti-phage system protein SduA domain-containing protein [Streptomyces sp. NPDC005865]|uniref:Shedu anti-phage system protein SduA domain-containing protein n=1 Tax=Streptomyces sp. NPDC005865 TaxID=3155453 RepID=UPI0033C847B5
MAIRADATLEEQVRRAAGEAVDEGVRGGLDAVGSHLRGGRGGKLRGGDKKLLVLLAQARAAAAAAGEWHVVRLVQDAVDYAEGRLLKPELQDRLRLFRDGRRPVSQQTYLSRVTSSGYDHAADAGEEFLFGHPDAGPKELIGHLRSLAGDARFLDAPPDRPGRYVIPRGAAEIAIWVERILRDGRIDIEDPADAARRLVTSPDALALLAADHEGQLVLRAAELRRRAAGLDALRKVVEDPEASEYDLQQALQGQPWIFGGRYVAELAQRRLVPGDELDIPLLRGDGALHIVELKRARGLKGALVKKHRDAWVPTAQVHDAVGQAVNYLVGLDENRDRIRAQFRIETRRASALVLVGHPDVQPDVPEEQLNEALRTFNSHVSRVEVLTYKELVDNAHRSLAGAPHTEERRVRDRPYPALRP